jgi:hypothetical protein
MSALDAGASHANETAVGLRRAAGKSRRRATASLGGLHSFQHHQISSLTFKEPAFGLAPSAMLPAETTNASKRKKKAIGARKSPDGHIVWPVITDWQYESTWGNI